MRVRSLNGSVPGVSCGSNNMRLSCRGGLLLLLRRVQQVSGGNERLIIVSARFGRLLGLLEGFLRHSRRRGGFIGEECSKVQLRRDIADDVMRSLNSCMASLRYRVMVANRLIENSKVVGVHSWSSMVLGG